MAFNFEPPYAAYDPTDKTGLVMKVHRQQFTNFTLLPDFRAIHFANTKPVHLIQVLIDTKL